MPLQKPLHSVLHDLRRTDSDLLTFMASNRHESEDIIFLPDIIYRTCASIVVRDRSYHPS